MEFGLLIPVNMTYLVDREDIGCRLSGIHDTAGHGEKTLTYDLISAH